MPETGPRIDVEVIEAPDGTRHEVRRYYHDCGGEHVIAHGEGRIDIAQCWREGGVEKRSTYRYCVDHGQPQADELRSSLDEAGDDR